MLNECSEKYGFVAVFFRVLFLQMVVREQR